MKKYAQDLYDGDDWGDGPIASSGYDYNTPAEALVAAVDKARELGADWPTTGAYIYKAAEHADEDGDNIGWSWTAADPTILYGLDWRAPNLIVSVGIVIPT